jgi:hypothetical protein
MYSDAGLLDRWTSVGRLITLPRHETVVLHVPLRGSGFVEMSGGVGGATIPTTSATCMDILSSLSYRHGFVGDVGMEALCTCFTCRSDTGCVSICILHDVRRRQKASCLYRFRSGYHKVNQPISTAVPPFFSGHILRRYEESTKISKMDALFRILRPKLMSTV